MSSDDLHALTDSQLREGTRDLVEERNRIDAELALTVRVGDSERAFAGCPVRPPRRWCATAGRWSSCRQWRTSTPRAG